MTVIELSISAATYHLAIDVEPNLDVVCTVPEREQHRGTIATS